MTERRGQAGWGFWLLWVAASMATFALGATALGGIARVTSGPLLGLPLGVVYGMTFVAVTASPGLAHGWLLRSRVARAGRWVWVSGLGSLLGFGALTLGMNAALWVVGGESAPALPMSLALGAAFALAGALAGIPQWLVLRPSVPRAGWWVPASALAWAGAGLVYLWATRGNDVGLTIGGAASGALSGAGTGLALVGLLRQARRDGAGPSAVVPA